MNNSKYTVISFVSGKGGVGKTTLASNVAWLMHGDNSRVMLIDLDFQNLGATGLFSGLYVLPSTCAYDLLHGSLPDEKPEIYSVEKNMMFLPGNISSDESYSDINVRQELNNPEDIYSKLSELLKNLHEWFHVDCFILDCHGGIDSTSLAAAGVSDVTLLVTEADSITFSGTLALLESYVNFYKDTDVTPRIEFIVNRIPDKYRWRDLNELYGKYFREYLDQYSALHEIALFIPSENYIADSFGEYPFQVKLDANSLLTKKLMLLIYKILKDDKDEFIPIEIKQKLSNEKKRKKINVTVSSPEAKGIKHVFTSFGITMLYTLLIVPLMIVAEINSSVFDGEYILTALISVFSILGVVVIYYIYVSSWKILFYFKSRLKYRCALFDELEIKPTLERIGLWKIRVLYIGSAFGVFVLTIYLVSISIVMLAMLQI